MAQNPYSAHLAQCIAIVKQQGYTLTVIRLVGSGTYSQVYTVTHSGYPNKNLCLKILETDHAEGPSGIEYRSQERAGQLLNGVADHVIVPRVYQDFNLGSWRGILMDYFPFETLSRAVQRISTRGSPLSERADLYQFIGHLGAALNTLLRGGMSYHDLINQTNVLLQGKTIVLLDWHRSVHVTGTQHSPAARHDMVNMLVAFKTIIWELTDDVSDEVRERLRSCNTIDQCLTLLGLHVQS